MGFYCFFFDAMAINAIMNPENCLILNPKYQNWYWCIN